MLDDVFASVRALAMCAVSDYVELHCHSCFSFREGASTPLELVLTARELGYDTLALTDHDSLAGAMEFALSAKEWDLTPIIGAEITLRNDDGARAPSPAQDQRPATGDQRPPHHLTLIAETPRGYGNISRLISHAHLSSPRDDVALDPGELAACANGVIAFSGCSHGEVPRLAAAGDIDAAVAAASRYAAIFGRDNFFIELQQNFVRGDRARNNALLEVARRCGLTVVATNNVHYHARPRHRLQDVLVAVRHRSTLDASERLRRPNAEFYLKRPEMMARLFADVPEAISNTRRIAERCRFDLTRDLTYRFPDFYGPDGKSADDFLQEVCFASAKDYYGRITPDLESRIRNELSLIAQAEQAGFFLRNWALMQHARRNNLASRGRGSSVGSLVCYLLGLSGIDPIKYNLFSGRFLNEARRKEDVPDIDIDFAREAREAMFAHVFETYGTERAAMVANVIQYKYPMAVRDVGKAMGLPEATIDKLAKRMRGRFHGALLEEMRQMPELRGPAGGAIETPLWQQFVNLVEDLKRKPRHLGQHSGGMIISDTPIVEQVPVQPTAMEGRYICQWDKDSVADAGFIKMDFLGYPSLGHLYRALALIEERRGLRIDPVRIPLDDPEVYEMIQRGDILGIVQIQSRAQLQAILRLKISCIEDLVVQVALIRPGPIQGGAVNPYITRCQGKEPVTYDHPCLEPILGETKGVIIFQEQVLEVAMAIAGFTAGQAESLRRAMSRKRSREEMEKLRAAFMDGARVQGLVGDELAGVIFEKIVAFAEFGFPKSHAAAMAETAGKIAWVKRYYPLEFYCAWLNEWPFGFYSPGVIVNEARRHGVEVRAVDVNRSHALCVIEDEAIRLGYNYVRGIGEKTRAVLEETRWGDAEVKEEGGRQRKEAEAGNWRLEDGRAAYVTGADSPPSSLFPPPSSCGASPYTSLWDFWRRTRIEAEPIERLIRLGAFAFTGLHERDLLWQLGLFYRPLGSQMPMGLPFDADQVALPEMTHEERIAADLAYTEGAIVSRGHLMDLAYGEKDEDGRPRLHEGITPSHLVDRMEDGAKVSVAGFVAVRQAPETAKGFVFHTLEDRWGLMNIITKPHLVKKYQDIIERASALIVHGHIERQERAVNVVTERMEELPLQGGPPAGAASHNW
jgi:error-prone DNA polymerase